MAVEKRKKRIEVKKMEENKSKLLVEAESIDDSDSQDYPIEVSTKSGTSNVLRFLDGSDNFKKYWQSWFYCDDESNA